MVNNATVERSGDKPTYTLVITPDVGYRVGKVTYTITSGTNPAGTAVEVPFENSQYKFTVNQDIPVPGQGTTPSDTKVNVTVTFEKIQEVAAKLKDGSVKVFDINTFTINNGQKVADDHLADVDTDAAYTADTDVVDGGEFQESLYRSAPYFDLRIDGIKLLNEAYGE